jgi:uncharacterized integral membrane protein
MRWFKFLLLTILFLAAVLFSMLNMDPVTLRFGLYPVQEQTWLEIPEIPLFLVILLSILVGILIGGSADFYRHFQLNRTLRQNQKTIERLEKEVQSLRSASLDTTPSQEWSNQDLERR